MEEDDYYLKWEKHHNAFISVFDYLYQHNILVDCTLSAEEKQIKAHRIVLMACSPYLQKVLSEHSDKYPNVFFDIKFSALEAIVSYCYRGEVKVPFDEWNGFLEAAEVLQIKGLCKIKNCDEGGDDVLDCDTSDQQSKKRVSIVYDSDSAVSVAPKKKRKVVKNSDSCRLSGDMLMEDLIDGDRSSKQEGRNGYSALPEVKTEPIDLFNLSGEAQGSDNSDVDTDDTGATSGHEAEEIDKINEFLNASSTLLFPWTCNRCGEAFATRLPYEEHRRNCRNTDPASHPWKCHKCENAYKNKKDLIRHLIYCGNDLPRLYCNRCGSSYKYERGLRRHQKYCGTDVKPLKCPQCDKTYKYKRGLRRHQRRCGIAEALQFLAGKGVTPVVVTKRSLGLPFGDISRTGLPMITSTPQLTQLTQLTTIDRSIRDPDRTSAIQKTLEHQMVNGTLVTEPSVCVCGKVYKYQKSYDKHLKLCKLARKKLRAKKQMQRDKESDADDEREEEELVGEVEEEQEDQEGGHDDNADGNEELNEEEDDDPLLQNPDDDDILLDAEVEEEEIEDDVHGSE